MMSYSGNRIASKSDVGTYTYQNGNHRIDELETVAGYNPPEHFLSYTAEGKVDSLTEVTDTATVKLFTFTYGLDNQRFRMKYEVNDTLKYTRYYFGEYEKEIKADGVERNIDYIYADGTLIAIHVQQAGTDSTFFVYTDYLGSLRCITDTSGTTTQMLSFDAWGNRRNPITGERDSSVSNSFLLARGYTGHEHLDELGLINMNGRVYDPRLGMFLNPDNYVQAPDNTENFNRYTYCLNNPLMFTDPTGYTWWSHFWGWTGEQLSSIDPTMKGTITNSAIAAGIKIGSMIPTFIPSTIDFFGSGFNFSRYDPFLKGTISNNSARITMGLSTGSHSQVLSRFTWELPQTILGYGYSQGANYFGTVQNVDYYDGATILTGYKDHAWMGPGQAVTLGSFIIGNNAIAANPNNVLFQHEYGHYLQSQGMGWAYLPRVGIPSIRSKGVHDFHPVEQDANRRAFIYFSQKIGFQDDAIRSSRNPVDNRGWDFTRNPLDINRDGLRNDYVDFMNDNLGVLDVLEISSRWYDYVSWTLPYYGPIGVGLINAGNYNR